MKNIIIEQNNKKVGVPNNKKYTPRFKFGLVIEAIQNKDMAVISRKYNVNHSLISKWKSFFLEAGHEMFENNLDKEKIGLRTKIVKLEQTLGKKEVDM